LDRLDCSVTDIFKVTDLTSFSILKYTFLWVAAGLIVSSAESFADDTASTNPIKIKPAAIYHAVRGKPLSETLAQIAQRSGISFKINTDLGKDVVSQPISADNWANAVKSLLSNYNYTLTQEGGVVKTVIVMSRTHENDTLFPNSVSNSTQDLILIEPKFNALPSKYKEFPVGSITEIDLPINAVMNVKDGATITLDLPIGQYSVAHDHTVKENDGSKTWVGYLSNEGEGYRVFLSQGASGTMGIVTTPDGTYNIESFKGVTYLVDTNKLQHAGYEGDSVIPAETMMGAIKMDSTQSQVDQLQVIADSAKKVLDAANDLVIKNIGLLTNAQSQLKILQSQYNDAISKYATAQSLFNAATNAYKAKISVQNLAVLKTATINMANAKNVYLAALKYYQTAINTINQLTSGLNSSKSALTLAQTKFDQALKSLNAAKATLVATTSPSNGSTTNLGSANKTVIDLMVVYTTAGQSSDYAKQRISLLVTASNQAYIDSGINMTLRLVYTEPTTYVESNSNSQALDDLANSRSAFATIGQKRLQYGADLVFLFRPLYAQTAGSCGTTYVEFAGGKPANKWAGYGTIGDGNSVDAKKGYYCAINTFTHEIGHSLGLVHDREYSNFTGVFDYSYAWGIQGSFATIMSYKQPVLMYFSSPALTTKCAGQPCGYPETDNARSSDQSKSVNYTAPIIANFMSTTVSTPILK
jgi:peptidyl-Asp metalloendopeptidase